MVILLIGPDTYRSLQRLEQLRQAFREKYDSTGLNTVSLDGDTASPAELRDALVSGGLFAKRRMVILDPYDPKRSTIKPVALTEIVGDHLKGRDLIVIVREVVPLPSDKRKKSTNKSWSVPGVTTEEFPLLSGPALQKWLLAEARSRGIQLPPAAARRLVEIIGADTWRLRAELEKLGAYANSRAITNEDIDQLSSDRVESDVFRLLDSIGQRQTAVAMQLVQREFQSGTHPLALVTALTRHIEHLLGAQSLAPAPASVVAKELGIHPYVATKAVAQAQRFKPLELKRWHQALFDIDRQLKSSALDAETLLLTLLART